MKVWQPLAFVLLFNSCLKDGKMCTHYTEITSTGHLVDIAQVQGIRELRDSLQKYPQLQVTRIIDNEYMIGFVSNIFYKDLLMYGEGYSVSRSKKYNFVSCISEPPPDTIAIDLNPVITASEAIHIAKGHMDFKDHCIAFRLCIFDLNAGIGNMPKNYRLAWLVENDHEGPPWVLVDAVSGEVIRSDDGIRT